MRRVVLDTNVFVSAVLIPRRNPSRILDLWRQGRFVLVLSPPIIEEIREVLRYPRLRPRHHLTDSRIDAFLTEFVRTAVTVEADVSHAVARDRDDDHVLACAVAGRADFIVSGDADLLDLGAYQSIRIVSPAAFLTMLESETSPA
jgi:putative PIN family toxin of toxin-antitoxin system